MVKVKGMWEYLNTDKFWAELSPNDEVMHLYDSDESLVASLSGFVFSGIRASEAVVVIATKSHLDLLDAKFRDGKSPFSLTVAGKYLPFVAETTLTHFMFNGMPDDTLFAYMLDSFLSRSRRMKKRVRIFAEMDALLLDDGNRPATEALDALWNKYRLLDQFCLLRAFPNDEVSRAITSRTKLRNKHLIMIGGETSQENVFFKRFA